MEEILKMMSTISSNHCSITHSCKLLSCSNRIGSNEFNPMISYQRSKTMIQCTVWVMKGRSKVHLNYKVHLRDIKQHFITVLPLRPQCCPSDNYLGYFSPCPSFLLHFPQR